jgi:hypothetical protein
MECQACEQLIQSGDNHFRVGNCGHELCELCLRSSLDSEQQFTCPACAVELPAIDPVQVPDENQEELGPINQMLTVTLASPQLDIDKESLEPCSGLNCNQQTNQYCNKCCNFICDQCMILHNENAFYRGHSLRPRYGWTCEIHPIQAQGVCVVCNKWACSQCGGECSPNVESAIKSMPSLGGAKEIPQHRVESWENFCAMQLVRIKRYTNDLSSIHLRICEEQIKLTDKIMDEYQHIAEIKRYIKTLSLNQQSQKATQVHYRDGFLALDRLYNYFSQAKDRSLGTPAEITLGLDLANCYQRTLLPTHQSWIVPDEVPRDIRKEGCVIDGFSMPIEVKPFYKGCYVRDQGTNRIWEIALPSGKKQEHILDEAYTNLPLWAIASDYKGKLWLSVQEQGQGRIHFQDPQGKKMVLPLPKDVRCPTRLHLLSKKENIFIFTDAFTDNMYIRTPHSFKRLEAPENCDRPGGIAVVTGGILIADSNNNRLLLFSLEGRFLKVITSEQYPFREPYGVCSDVKRKLIFVLERKGNRIQILNHKYKTIHVYGSQDSHFQLNLPQDIALYKEQFVIVSNTGAKSILLIPLRHVCPFLK